jgi:predicted neutral ceramidase superfamily lipid hydrolase
MAFTFTDIFGILIMHGIADFAIQTPWQASNKSSRLDALLYHTTMYSFSLVFMMVFLQSMIHPEWSINQIVNYSLLFGLISFIFHTITDFITSKWTRKLHIAKREHDFFCVIEFDQILHYLQLFLTYHILFR